jgi:hypothetical protein
MAQGTEQMPTLYLKHRGMFSHSGFVRAIQNWFTENSYRFHPNKYKLKSNEAEYEAYGERDIHEYVKFKISIHIWIRDMSEVEVVKDGEKIKMQEGSINLEMDGVITYDPNERFGSSKFMGWLRDFYRTYIVRQTMAEVWEDDLFLKMNELMGTIKNELGIEAA